MNNDLNNNINNNGLNNQPMNNMNPQPLNTEPTQQQYIQNQQVNNQPTNFQTPIQDNINYQNNVQPSNITPIENKNNPGKLNKILIITNIITAALLVVFIMAFILKDTNCESSNPVEKIEEEKNNYTSTATTEPVSKDWQKYQFSIKGKTLSLPCTYLEFKDISGFSMKSSDEKSYLERNSSIYVNLYVGDKDNQKLALYTDIKNDTSEDLQYSKSDIVRLNQTKSQVENYGAEVITFPGDLQVGMEMTKEGIIELFGEPGKIRDNSNEAYGGITIAYYGDEVYTTINYYEIQIYSGKIDSITLDHKKNKE